MTSWAKKFHTFGAGLRTAAVEWKLRQKHGAPEAQQRVYRKLIDRLAAGSFWREAGVVPGMSYDSFAARVAPRGYEQLELAIGRMTRGEADVLWPGRCELFAVSPGTSGVQRKYLPVTEEMLAHFRQAGLDALLYYAVRVRHAGVFRGRHLHLGGHHPLAPIAGASPPVSHAGDISSITALNLPGWVETHLYEPGPAIAQMTDWQEKLEAMVARTAGLDLTMISGIPGWVLNFAATVRELAARQQRRITHLQEIWPNLECYVHSGVPMGPFEDELRMVLGPTVSFHEVYSASEGWVAAQDIHAAAGLRLMADAGIFFEFLPMSQFDETRLEQLGPKVVPLDGVKTGVDYALLLTTPAGLARYVIGDVVRFVSTEPPRLVYVGRTNLLLNAFGEQVIERDVTDALRVVCARHNWRAVNFHVAPLAGNSLAGQDRRRHEWWIELQAGTVATPIGPQLAVELDTELQRLNADYAARRKGGAMEGPFVRLVMPGVFQHWLTYHGQWGGQHKMPRCRSDRIIADELAQVTHFAVD
jgi:hypothetical protein